MQEERFRRPPPPSSTEEELSFSQDELTELLQEASRREGSAAVTQQPVSLADALQTARDLGIPEENVLAAANEMKAAKVQRATRRAAMARRRYDFLRFLFLTLAISIGIGLSSGIHAAVGIFAAMSIPLLIIGSKYLLAYFEPEGSERESRRIRRRI